MRDKDCTHFLQRVLPRLGMRWAGFRRVRGQVGKRIGRRLVELGLPDVGAYEAYLETHPGEWTCLESLCRITISRFYRDRHVFECLEHEVLPALARTARAAKDPAIRSLSAGCASGEEPYTLAMVWELAVKERFPAGALRIVATDADDNMLRRAARGCYERGSLKDLPPAWREAAFERRGESFVLAPRIRAAVEFRRGDLREHLPDGPFHLILCRNLAFTYFDESWQRTLLDSITRRLVPGGALVLGAHEALPAGTIELSPWGGSSQIHRRR